MANPGNQFNSPAEELTAEAILALARSVMDEYALELFDLWFNGKAAQVVVLDNQKWSRYMTADKGLEAQIDDHLTRHAMMLRDQLMLKTPGPQQQAFRPVSQPYNTRFHAEAGASIEKGYKAYATGYGVLHGSNRAAGDFTLSGMIAMKQSLKNSKEIDVEFRNNTLTFNDIVDPNYRYAGDATFGKLAKNLARTLGRPLPRDYTLRIVWREPGPWLYGIPATNKTPGSPDWLKTFTNR